MSLYKTFMNNLKINTVTKVNDESRKFVEV